MAPVLDTFLSAGTGSLIRVTEERGKGTVLHRENVRQEQLRLLQQEPEAADHVTLGQAERSTGILLALLY